MKKISDLIVGFSDAENYQRRDYKELFNTFFVKNDFLDRLLNNYTYFLIGEKGTGKTAYAVFLANNNYNNNRSILKYIRETDYQKFATLKKEKHLQLSDYTSIWKVIILLLLSKSISKEEIDSNPFSKNQKLNSILNSIDAYYQNAFSPEIINALTLVENSNIAAELITKHLSLGISDATNRTFNESKFQVNLLFIQNQFERAIEDIKIKSDHLLFIDGIDIRPGSLKYSEYLECVKGLANAIWSLNNDFFAKIKGSKGTFRVILLLRPDIFNSLDLQNLTNKILDNSVFLDWRTLYPNYRRSKVFEIADRLLSAQQETKFDNGIVWDFYFPWKAGSTNSMGDFDDSFIEFLRISYSRPRDIITMIKMMKDEHCSNHRDSSNFLKEDFDSSSFRIKYSEYLLGAIKDQLSFYYNSSDYEMFLRFFSFLNSQAEFTYKEYLKAYQLFIDYVLSNHDDIPEFIETEDRFLQFLYDTNIICYIEETDLESLIRWCYRERNPSNISPKVKIGLRYRIHYGLLKSLNVGFRKMKNRY